jgi:hypothetical protein
MVGGGIAGLATARALLRRDIEPEVVERAAAWSHPAGDAAQVTVDAPVDLVAVFEALHDLGDPVGTGAGAGGGSDRRPPATGLVGHRSVAGSATQGHGRHAHDHRGAAIVVISLRTR